MPTEKAAAVLGSYLGVPNLEPAAVLDLDMDQITGVGQLIVQAFQADMCSRSNVTQEGHISATDTTLPSSSAHVHSR